MSPTFPIIYANDFWIYLIMKEEELSHFSLKAVLTWNKSQRMLPSFAFDSAGKKWTIKPTLDSTFRLCFWKRLIAPMFYNPLVKVSIHWTDLGQCDFEEPKNLFISSISIEADHTQEFERAEQLIERINEAKNMPQLIEVLVVSN